MFLRPVFFFVDFFFWEVAVFTVAWRETKRVSTLSPYKYIKDSDGGNSFLRHHLQYLVRHHLHHLKHLFHLKIPTPLTHLRDSTVVFFPSSIRSISPHLTSPWVKHCPKHSPSGPTRRPNATLFKTWHQNNCAPSISSAYSWPVRSLKVRECPPMSGIFTE